MKSILSHITTILLLPFTVTVIIPELLMRWFTRRDSRWSSRPASHLPKAAGASLIGVGSMLLSWCVYLFAKVGRGTLAPWDPTQNLVARGPYRYTRNPMITGVGLILLGRAVHRGSWVLGLWTLYFFVSNHIYFIRSEEPGLEKRFGDTYRDYKARVPRWIPRLDR
jgi:protein-S-isoprenylcysteine O-methyltransferase Ste14